jgi:hypothetical protein
MVIPIIILTVIAVVGGVIELALIGFTVVSFIFSNNSKGKKAKKSKK